MRMVVYPQGTFRSARQEKETLRDGQEPLQQAKAAARSLLDEDVEVDAASELQGVLDEDQAQLGSEVPAASVEAEALAAVRASNAAQRPSCRDDVDDGKGMKSHDGATANEAAGAAEEPTECSGQTVPAEESVGASHRPSSCTASASLLRRARARTWDSSQPSILYL